MILFANYNNSSAPAWFGLVCFTVLAVGISFPFAWLRLKSGSLWTAVILHAAHNVFIQAFLHTAYRAYPLERLRHRRVRHWPGVGSRCGGLPVLAQA